jgi:hypothetical protein
MYVTVTASVTSCALLGANLPSQASVREFERTFVNLSLSEVHEDVPPSTEAQADRLGEFSKPAIEYRYTWFTLGWCTLSQQSK